MKDVNEKREREKRTVSEMIRHVIESKKEKGRIERNERG